jgi:hypothetical protein
MTDQEINVAIAEACGKDMRICPAHHSRTCCGRQGNFPDYCTDLNAMHEAEKMLTTVQCAKYETHLGNTCNRVWHATPRQRAEAFLRVIGKWKETT